jgi:hypothetical protein
MASKRIGLQPGEVHCQSQPSAYDSVSVGDGRHLYALNWMWRENGALLSTIQRLCQPVARRCLACKLTKLSIVDLAVITALSGIAPAHGFSIGVPAQTVTTPKNVHLVQDRDPSIPEPRRVVRDREDRRDRREWRRDWRGDRRDRYGWYNYSLADTSCRLVLCPISYLPGFRQHLCAASGVSEPSADYHIIDT